MSWCDKTACPNQEINTNDDEKGVVNKEELPPYIYI
jgi:hypothetical protein